MPSVDQLDNTDALSPARPRSINVLIGPDFPDRHRPGCQSSAGFSAARPSGSGFVFENREVSSRERVFSSWQITLSSQCKERNATIIFDFAFLFVFFLALFVLGVMCAWC